MTSGFYLVYTARINREIQINNELLDASMQQLGCTADASAVLRTRNDLWQRHFVLSAEKEEIQDLEQSDFINNIHDKANKQEAVITKRQNAIGQKILKKIIDGIAR